MLQKCQERTKSRAHPPWPTRGEGWGSMRSRVVAMYDDGSAAHAGLENLSSKRGATIGPARDRQHGGFGPPAGPGLADVHHPGSSPAGVGDGRASAAKRFHQMQRIDAGSPPARTAEGECRPWNIRALAVFCFHMSSNLLPRRQNRDSALKVVTLSPI